MSRVKKSQNKRNQKIRETILGLSLALFIGVAGSAGSYAYFSDMVNTDNGIKITMGTLDVGIGEGFKLDIDGAKKDDDNKYFKDYEKFFQIKNEGTLDEILTLKFQNISINKDSNHQDLDKIEYEIVIKNETGEVIYSLNKVTLNDLPKTTIKLGRLNSGKALNCTAKIDDEGITPNYQQDITINFDLVVDGIQINDTNGGAN